MNPEQFVGWITALAPPVATRLVIGHWHRSYGVGTDVIVEDPAGPRTLYSPTSQLTEFLSATGLPSPCRRRQSFSTALTPRPSC